MRRAVTKTRAANAEHDAANGEHGAANAEHDAANGGHGVAGATAHRDSPRMATGGVIG